MTASKKPRGITGARKKSLTVRLFVSKDGTAAIEFAIIAPVFLMLMFSMFEVGWFFYVNSVVDASVGDAARLIETGQIQKSTGTDAQKKAAMFNQVCRIVQHFGDCNERLTVDVRTFPSFSALAAATDDAVCADASDSEKDAIPFDPGSERAIVRVRICMIYTTLNPAIGVNVSEAGSSNRRLVSQSIFRSEPYLTNGS